MHVISKLAPGSDDAADPADTSGVLGYVCGTLPACKIIHEIHGHKRGQKTRIVFQTKFVCTGNCEKQRFHGESSGQNTCDTHDRGSARRRTGPEALRIGSAVINTHVQQNGSLSHPQDIDAPLRIAAQRKIAAYRQQYADNQNISFLPAIVSTSTRMHCEFCELDARRRIYSYSMIL